MWVCDGLQAEGKGVCEKETGEDQKQEKEKEGGGGMEGLGRRYPLFITIIYSTKSRHNPLLLHLHHD